MKFATFGLGLLAYELLYTRVGCIKLVENGCVAVHYMLSTQRTLRVFIESFNMAPPEPVKQKLHLESNL